MVAYNFQKRFAEAVRSGVKTQTIRAFRKTRHVKVGEPVQLYTGMRTKSCEKLIDPDPICTLSCRCMIQEFGVFIGEMDGKELYRVDAEQFAQADGFLRFEDLKKWFRETHSLPFTGRVIGWTIDGAEE